MSYNIELVCKECGEPLQAVLEPSMAIEIEPCDTCLTAKYDEGFDDGKKENE
jgi:hypothetical protein